MALTLALNLTPGQTVSGVVTVTATSNVVASKVRFFLNGKQASEDIAYPWSWIWDTRSVGDGLHTVEVQAMRSGRVFATRSTVLEVDNVVGPQPQTFNVNLTANLSSTATVAKSATSPFPTLNPGTTVYPKETQPTATSNRTLRVYWSEFETPAGTSNRKLVVYWAELQIPGA